MAMTRAYWKAEIETSSAEARRRLKSEGLVQQIAYNYRSSPFFAAKLDAAGVKPSAIRDVSDLASIPFMEKQEIAASQADGTLLGVNQCAPLESILRIQATGGTTGLPMRIGMTGQDIEDYFEMADRALWAMSCRPPDILFTCMNFSLYPGAAGDHPTFYTHPATSTPPAVSPPPPPF